MPSLGLVTQTYVEASWKQFPMSDPRDCCLAFWGCLLRGSWVRIPRKCCNRYMKRRSSMRSQRRFWPSQKWALGGRERRAFSMKEQWTIQRQQRFLGFQGWELLGGIQNFVLSRKSSLNQPTIQLGIFLLWGSHWPIPQRTSPAFSDMGWLDHTQHSGLSLDFILRGHSWQGSGELNPCQTHVRQMPEFCL